MTLRIKRSLFVVIVLSVAFLDGYYFADFGLGWVIGSTTITIILAIGWMRTYWNPNQGEG